jgi:G:T/U-mismatch repair DNA glycosylase
MRPSIAAASSSTTLRRSSPRTRASGRVCCNGATAAALYRRLVLPTLPAPVAALPLQTLPSTSPAHAALSFDTKQARWLEALLGAQSP